MFLDKGVYNEAATEICASMDQIGGVDEKSDKCPWYGLKII